MFTPVPPPAYKPDSFQVVAILKLSQRLAVLPRLVPDSFCQEYTATWLPYSLTIEKVTVGMSARNSHAEA